MITLFSELLLANVLAIRVYAGNVAAVAADALGWRQLAPLCFSGFNKYTCQRSGLRPVYDTEESLGGSEKTWLYCLTKI